MNIVGLIIILVMLPFVTYFVFKLGRYGYLKAGQRFKEENHGDSKEEESGS